MEDTWQQYCCPLTKKILLDPVKTCEGTIYEREAIEEWLSKNSLDPISKKSLVSKNLSECPELQDKVFEYLRQNPKHHSRCYKPADWKKIVLPRLADYSMDTLALFSMLGAPKELVNSHKLNKMLKKVELPAKTEEIVARYSSQLL